MLKFLKGFFVLMILYHIIVTVVCYGILGGQYPELPAILRDGLRIMFFTIIFFVYLKDWKNYFITRKYPWLALVILMIWGILISLIANKSISDMLIGIKYGFFYIFIFLSASFIGFVSKEKLKSLQKFKTIGYWLVGIVIAGFVRQGAKLIWPELFMNMGYGPLDDFFFGKNPPIYYLTGFEGTLRRQGLFSGPNNYGYFLVAFLPIILLFFGVQIKKWKELLKWKNKEIWSLIWISIWILAILFTLSRTAILGGAFVFAILNINRIRKNKIKSGIIVLVGILGIIALSILKETSTLNHISAKFASINRVIQKPMGMGLGTAGPAIHHNGTILPENYFIQIMIDIGTIGFILWAFVWYTVIGIGKKIKKIWLNKKDDKDMIIYLIRKYLNIGRLALLIMGIFLHVFEDSMVNYLFFISYGIVTGYLTKNIAAKD